jgi:hypothetical protein
MNLPKKFSILRKMVQREGLDKVTPNQVLGDVMTDAQYDDDDMKMKMRRRRSRSSKRRPPHSKLHPQRARARLIVIMIIHLMMRPWPF